MKLFWESYFWKWVIVLYSLLHGIALKQLLLESMKTSAWPSQRPFGNIECTAEVSLPGCMLSHPCPARNGFLLYSHPAQWHLRSLLANFSPPLQFNLVYNLCRTIQWKSRKVARFNLLHQAESLYFKVLRVMLLLSQPELLQVGRDAWLWYACNPSNKSLIYCKLQDNLPILWIAPGAVTFT